MRIVIWTLHIQDKLWVPLEKIMVDRNLTHAPKGHWGLADSVSPLKQATLEIWHQLNKEGLFFKIYITFCSGDSSKFKAELKVIVKDH